MRTDTMKRMLAGFAGAICIVFAIAPWAAQAIAAVMHMKFFTVPTGSMEPAVSAGSLACIATDRGEEPREGDIIAFMPDTNGAALLHRIVAIDPDTGTIRTKGDANPAEDRTAINPEDVIGVMRWSVPYLGYALETVGTDYGKACSAMAAGAGAMLVIMARTWPARGRRE